MPDEEPPVMLTMDGVETTVVYEERVEKGGGGTIHVVLGPDTSSPVDTSVPATGGGGTSGADAPPPTPTGTAPRTQVGVPFVGGPRITLIPLTNSSTSYAGLGHPANTGQASLGLVALDAGGNVLATVNLEPGQSLEWFHGPEGTDTIAVGNREMDTPLNGELTIDFAGY